MFKEWAIRRSTVSLQMYVIRLKYLVDFQKFFGITSKRPLLDKKSSIKPTLEQASTAWIAYK